MKAEVHHSHRLQLNAGPNEFAAKLAITYHRPLSALTVGCHDCWVVDDLHFLTVTALATSSYSESPLMYISLI